MDSTYVIEVKMFGKWVRSTQYHGTYSSAKAKAIMRKEGQDPNYRATIFEPSEPEVQEPTPDAVEELKKLADFLRDLRNKRIVQRSQDAYESGVITGLDVAREQILIRLEELGVK